MAYISAASRSREVVGKALRDKRPRWQATSDLGERPASVNVCRLCIAFAFTLALTCFIAFAPSVAIAQRGSGGGTSGSSTAAPLLPPLLPLRAPPSRPRRNRLRGRLCSGSNQLRISRRPCRHRPPLQETARSAARDPPVWPAPVAQARVRKAPRAAAVTHFRTA
jgi:hypothetical protein